MVRHLLVFAEEKWRISGDRPGSGNTANIGGIDYILDILAGNGVFSNLGEEVFNKYWANQGILQVPDPRSPGRSKRLTRLAEFLESKGIPYADQRAENQEEAEMSMAVVPPIKSQGIKTKLVDWIGECASLAGFNRWVEPFTGTGVVAFSLQPRSALLCDSNPHLIAFYKSVQAKKVTGDIARRFLVEEGKRLLESGGEHYYAVRDRFNREGNPLDFLFLSRSCFNGMMRFNRKGGFNVPFCKKPNRFAQALVTKICNQIEAVAHVMDMGDYTFKHQEFSETLSEVKAQDLVYCDPPYIGRHVDYFDSWSESEEQDLHDSLAASGAKFIMSTWAKNRYRENPHVLSTWGDCSILTKEHFYHVGPKETNRNAVTEALLTNFWTPHSSKIADSHSKRHAKRPNASGSGGAGMAHV